MCAHIARVEAPPSPRQPMFLGKSHLSQPPELRLLPSKYQVNVIDPDAFNSELVVQRKWV